ncbi:MAG: arginyl-tRNA synthetase [Alphaproteobacteria bacterium]|jgi:arginyl-tRNA synthetase|nr:arginyl-tRNA synthetase [Alphaproteobacteria bacterium]
MTSLLSELSATAGAAFAAEGLPVEFGQIQVSDRADLAQFQCNGALAAAKLAKSNPRAIAEKIAARLRDTGLFADVSIAGPGFVNLKLKDEVLQQRLQRLAAEPESAIPDSGAGSRAIVDFGGPNIAKPMHVGHLRSAIIGDCLQRLFRANGWEVTSDVHLGDWGLPMGQLIAELAIRRPDLPYFDPADRTPYPEHSPVSMDDLERLYPEAAAACKADPGQLEAARQATLELQAGRPGYRALWRHFHNVSATGLTREFESLGVVFDEWKGESDADPLIPEMIEKLKDDGLAVMDQGALIVSVAKETDTSEMPPLILVKSDGAVNYATTDMATIVERVREHDPDLILYVVDQRQHLHFEQVFRAATKGGLTGRAGLEHIGYGTVNGKDGKPFKTRAGGVMKLYDLIAMATDEAMKRLNEQGLAADYPDEERNRVAKAVGLAAIKFADLSNNRVSGYVFDLERFTRFEGKTGPYLQYAAVRIKSILRKAEGEGYKSAAPVIRSEAESKLALQLLAMPEALLSAETKRAPNLLCDFVFVLAQNFSRFYTEHHILSESDEALRAARLGLCALTLTQIERALDLLGIEVPERM